MAGISRGMTQRAIWLGQIFKELRSSHGGTLKDIGEYLGRNASSVGRSENGEVPFRVSDVLALLNFYGVSDERRRAEIEELARDLWRKGWWDQFHKDISVRFIDYAWLEGRATEIRSFDGLVLAGLLQTREYAEAIIQAAHPDGSEDYLRRGLEFRIERQKVLDRERSMLFKAVIDEGVLRRVVGGADVMRAQLNHLLDLDKHERVEIRVLPFGTGAHAASEGSFQVLCQPHPYPEVGYAETLAGQLYVEQDDAARFVRAYDRLEKSALDPKDSATFIAAVAKEL